MHFISSGFIFVSPCRYHNRPASHFDRTTQGTPLLYNNFPLELPFELCQLESSWSVLYILNFIDNQYLDSFFEGCFFPLLHSNEQPFLSSFLCPCLALFSLLKPLFAQPRCQPLSTEEAVRSRAGMGAGSSVLQHQILKLY